MKKFSKKSPSTAPSDDPNRSTLFGTRGSPSPPSLAPDQPAKGNPYDRQDSYAKQQTEFYSSQRQDAYAGNPSAPYPLPQPQQRPSAASPSYSDESLDSARNALFGNRPPPSQRDPHTRDLNEPDHYQEYQQEAQDDDEDVEATKQEIRFVKQDSLASTQNAIRVGLEAEEQGRNSLARLGTQSEQLSSAEQNLDISAAHARLADEKAKELKKLNRSIFAVHMSNPFTAKSRAEEEERRIMERHRLEREERERNRREAYQSTQRVNDALNPRFSTTKSSLGASRSTVTSRSPYSFEADEADVEMERDINANLNTLGGITSRLKGLALATRTEIEAQNDKLDKISNKGHNLHNSIHINTKRLERIH